MSSTIEAHLSSILKLMNSIKRVENVGGKMINIEAMQAIFFKALAHPIRLKIIKSLKDGAKCVCELKKDIPFSQSNLSGHLKILKEAGILVDKKVGNRIEYMINDEKVMEIVSQVNEIISRRIINLKNVD